MEFVVGGAGPFCHLANATSAVRRVLANSGGWIAKRTGGNNATRL